MDGANGLESCQQSSGTVHSVGVLMHASGQAPMRGHEIRPITHKSAILLKVNLSSSGKTEEDIGSGNNGLSAGMSDHGHRRWATWLTGWDYGSFQTDKNAEI